VGRCALLVEGVDATSVDTPQSALEVGQLEPLNLTVETTAAAENPEIQVEMAGLRWSLSQPVPREGGWEGMIQLQEFAWAGVGLYKVIARNTGPGACFAFAFIDVGGRPPLSTVAGGLGVAATLVGLLLIMAVTVMVTRERRALADKAWTEGRVRWRPWVSPVAIVGGLMLVGGLLLLLQQFAVVYPTPTIALVAVLAGVALAVTVPSVARFMVVRQTNRASSQA
jgi:hypothetical protein